MTKNEIAEKRLIPPSFVRRIVARLAAEGILSTTRGAGGGIRLARPASEISVLDVVRVFEGGIVLNRCVPEPQECPLMESCPAQRTWTEATRQVESFLASRRFDQLAALGETLGSGSGYPLSIESGTETGDTQG